MIGRVFARLRDLSQSWIAITARVIELEMRVMIDQPHVGLFFIVEKIIKENGSKWLTLVHIRLMMNISTNNERHKTVMNEITLLNNTINNRNRDESGRYAKWTVCEYDGCKNILGDLDDGAWTFGNHGEFLCLNHDVDEYENGENYTTLTRDGKPLEYRQSK